MRRTLAVLLVMALSVPTVFAEDIHATTTKTPQSSQPEAPMGTAIDEGTTQTTPMITVDTPIDPSISMTAMMNEMGTSDAMPLSALIDLGLSAKQIERLIDIRADLWKKQLPLVDKLVKKQIDLAVLEQNSPQDVMLIRDAKKYVADLQTELKKMNDLTLSEAMKVLNNDQRASLGDRPLPLFAAENAPIEHPMMPGWGMHSSMMGKASSEASGK